MSEQEAGRRLTERDGSGYFGTRPFLTGYVSRGEETYPTVELAQVTVEGKPHATAFVPNRWRRAE